MNTNASQFPASLGGFKSRGVELPSDFSAAALPAAGKGKWKDGVRTIDRSKDKLGINMSAEKYNKASSDITEMRKSGEAAKYSAAAKEAEAKGSFSTNKPAKKTIKVKSN